jgi:hypothetical protein
MRRYMLDTDTCSYIMKRSNNAVLERLQKVPATMYTFRSLRNRNFCTVSRCLRDVRRTKWRSARSCSTLVF